MKKIVVFSALAALTLLTACAHRAYAPAAGVCAVQDKRGVVYQASGPYACKEAFAACKWHHHKKHNKKHMKKGKNRGCHII